MKRPNIENLKAKMRGETLNAYQKGLALNDYEMLLKYMNHLEQENQRVNSRLNEELTQLGQCEATLNDLKHENERLKLEKDESQHNTTL